ncbi:transcriptional regulator, AraC family [Gordonia polyisoprenivorans VH2]|uniref:Transcriptional regulator, AraC family n=1 Tax=Gordonia polyisoprenivorans (strain DSM 44266 / VH2) TaxID=1112204 RepID=H6MWC6_GORPV|nr:helix-turn-helix domain-containing protein [Gordonia polyisoprenivorans]AFA74131.1 transcriptional regulator, AraC family [Gordonia polyisoprenivorans VH2]
MTSAERSARPATCWRADTAPGESVILPDGCMDLIWTGEELLIAGPDTGPYVFGTDRRRDMTGLRFAPGYAPGLLGAPASEFRDSRVPLSDLWPSSDVRRWEDTLAAADDVGAALSALCDATPGQSPPPWVPTLPLMLARGVPVSACADTVSVSARTLHRMSLQHFGYGPKTLARILRMRTALALLDDAGEDLSGIAARAGYADHAHMCRDFAELTGAPPTAWTGGAQTSGL